MIPQPRRQVEGPDCFGRHGDRRAASGANLRRQVVDANDIACGHDHQALDRVAQLADVAAPAIALQRVHRRRVEAPRLQIVLIAGEPGEVLDQQRDVLAAFPQRRHDDRNHIETEEQISRNSPR
jgi:hypothetical protein